MQTPPILYRFLFFVGTAAVLGGFVVGIYRSLTDDGRLPPITLNYMEPIQSLVEGEDFEAAAEQARIALELDEASPSARELRKILAQALADGGEGGAAIPEYRKALERRPEDADAHYGLGVALMQQGKLEEAVASYERALELNPEHAAAHNNLGTTLCRLDRGSEGVRHLRDAIRLEPDYAEAHFNLASILFANGRADEAANHLREALRIRPDYEKARAALQQIEGGSAGAGG